MGQAARGSALCTEDPARKLKPFFKKFGQRLTGCDYGVDIVKVDLFDGPEEVINQLTLTCTEIFNERDAIDARYDAIVGGR